MQLGMPCMLACMKYVVSGRPRVAIKFGLTDEMLRQAILDDEVQVKTQDGVAFCQWRQLKEKHVDERATNAKLALEQKKVTGNQAAQLRLWDPSTNTPIGGVDQLDVGFVIRGCQPMVSG